MHETWKRDAQPSLVLGLEAGTVTIPQLQLFTEQFYLHISKCFHGSALSTFAAPMRM